MTKHKMPETYQDIQKVQFPREESDSSSPTWKEDSVANFMTIILFRVCNTEIDDIAMIVFNFTKQSIQSWAG